MSHVLKLNNGQKVQRTQKVLWVVSPDEVYSAGVSCLFSQALMLVSMV